MKTLLLVEDDKHLADGLKLNLEAEGYQVIHISDGSLAAEEIRQGRFDMILLDIMLPGIDGLTLCKQLRAGGYTIPILFITARSLKSQIIEGLIIGGDDYVTKPFNTAELLARIQGIFRRLAWLSNQNETGNIYKFKDREINFATYEAKGPGGVHKLGRRECMILKYLIERKGEVVTRDDLLDAVWGYDAFPSNRTIDNFIVRIRKILEDDPKKPLFFETVWGTGYRFNDNPDNQSK